MVVLLILAAWLSPLGLRPEPDAVGAAVDCRLPMRRRRVCRRRMAFDAASGPGLEHEQGPKGRPVDLRAGDGSDDSDAGCAESVAGGGVDQPCGGSASGLVGQSVHGGL